MIDPRRYGPVLHLYGSEPHLVLLDLDHNRRVLNHSQSSDCSVRTVWFRFVGTARGQNSPGSGPQMSAHVEHFKPERVLMMSSFHLKDVEAV